MRLRDGEFTVNNKNANLTTEAWAGKVTMADGTSIPAIFRPNSGVAGYNERMLTEVSGYSSGRVSGIGQNMPVSVARSVEVGGTTYNGYVQLMQGVDLRAYLSQQAKSLYGSDTPQNMLKAFRADKELQNSFANALGERMILGEWDNHALNNLVVEQGGRKPVLNIDMQDALKPARYTWDLRPDPGFLNGWEGLNGLLYKDLIGKTAPQPLRDNARQFVSAYGSMEGCSCNSRPGGRSSRSKEYSDAVDTSQTMASSLTRRK